jgi:Chalcone isomerase-like
MPMNRNRRQTLSLALLIGLFYIQRLGAQTKTSEADSIRIKRLQPYLQTPTLIGQGKFTYWGFDVYVASLWASESSVNPEQWQKQRIALELNYLRDFKGPDIAKSSIDEIHTQSQLSKSRANLWLKTLEGIFPNIEKGQTLVGVYIPNVGAQFLDENTQIGEIKDIELAKRFFDIWLSPQTTAPQLRKRLFAGNLDK